MDVQCSKEKFEWYFLTTSTAIDMSIRVAAPVEIIRGFFNLEHSSIKGTSSISGEAILYA